MLTPLTPVRARRLLIISSEFPPNVGGIGNHAYNLAKALVTEGFEVSVVADIIGVDDNQLEKFSSKENFKIYWVKRKRFVFQTYFARILKALSHAKKADKVICSGKFSLWIGILIRARNPMKELVAVVHGTELDLRSAPSKKVTSYSIKKFNKIIAVSNYTKQFLPRFLPTRIQQFVIHNGINGGEFNIPSNLPLTGNPALITVGNVTDRKGQDNVINALPEIVSEYPTVHYHIVGKPTNKQKLDKKVEMLGLGDHITFHGAVSRDELLQKIENASIKLMLSNHTSDGDFEGFGIAVLEANAFGVPAIGSRNSGISDAIKDGETGLLVDQSNPKEIAEAVKTVLTNYPSFSKNAKSWAEQHDWKIIVKEYVAALEA
ncbi:MAG: glycosyltransferase [Segetibacter sp.]|nr:glycosyltransferase [Segetibacter sp.]